jgi:ferric-dicitrate binding protein FerR (iron transport regulator)
MLLAAVATAAPNAQPAGSVTFLAGEATRSAGGKAEKLAVGKPVFQGDVLETQKRTRLEVKLADGSVVRLGPTSKAEVQAAAFGKSVEDRNVSAKLLVGKVWANVAKAVGGEQRFEVKTENAVAGVRGTTFRVDAATDKSVVVKVYSGTVAVAGGVIPRPEHKGQAAPETTGTTRPPGGKRERVLIDGPKQVTREQWERIVTNMMEVRVSSDGTPTEPEKFALATPGEDEWEEWNRSRDEAM